MKNLIFEKIENGYEAVFDTSNDFSLHLESEEDLRVVVYHTSAEGGAYDVASVISGVGKVADKEYRAKVYPKKIRLFTTNVITMCTVADVQVGSSSGDADVDELRAMIQEQARINDEQQEQIDENTRVNEQQEEKIIDGTDIASEEKIHELFKK